MTELLISEITRMGNGFCVIGLERRGKGFASLRPVPRTTAWLQFPYARADRVTFDLTLLPMLAPHFEDRSARNHRRLGSTTEAGLVECLKQAEVASSIKELFGCDACRNTPRGNVYVDPDDAKRSICGFEINSIRFRFFPESIRAALTLDSGETLDSLPVVDRDWNAFVALFKDQSPERLETFFNSFVKKQVMSSPIRFARIGIARPDTLGRCWLMLDSLFPLPKQEWATAYE